MKKQVTFTESLTIDRLHGHKAAPRRVRREESVLDVNRSATAEVEHVTVIEIPKTMTGAPFLKHAALTPGQREYLYTIAASYSTAHVRNVITQHYMNVLHRRIRAGHDCDRDDMVVTSPESESEKPALKAQSHVSSKLKHKGKMNVGAKPHGKSDRQASSSASKHGKMKKRTTSPRLRRKGPGRSRISLLEEEEEDDEEGADDSLSDCLSSLFLGEWDDDAFTDL
ncbi:hypothetical protein INR49_018767 [Caranx melampygus]|nr:hypothetical protein INR49_018767 [Caranx melampygus]